MPESLNYSIDQVQKNVNILLKSPKNENSLHKDMLYNPLCEQVIELANAVGILSEEVERLSVGTQNSLDKFEEITKKVENGRKNTKKRGQGANSGNEEANASL